MESVEVQLLGFQELGLRRSVVGDPGLVFQFWRFGFTNLGFRVFEVWDVDRTMGDMRTLKSAAGGLSLLVADAFTVSVCGESLPHVVSDIAARKGITLRA